MARTLPPPASVRPRTTLAGRFAAFIAERQPFALRPALAAFERVVGNDPGRDDARIDALRRPLVDELARLLAGAPPEGLPETIPGVSVEERLHLAKRQLFDDVDGFLRREALAASLTREERLEMLRGMVLTRATDNRLKAFFAGGEVRYRGVSFQGKGFRSLGQEAIYAAAIRLKRGPRYRAPDGTWQGDVVAPLIRDLGAALAMWPEPEAVRAVLNAQMGKSGPPMNGKDLHVGGFEHGVLPPAAPLAISSLTIAGIAMSFARRRSGRVAVSFIGEGGTSLGEWHEAINACAARSLPAIFCVENNQTALSTPVSEQSAVRVFADKAAGYGIPSVTLDGTDPEAIAAAFAWAAERARAGTGPSLIELVCLRLCGHAHHDDMLYLGKEPPISWEYPPRSDAGYADPDLFAFWSKRDPIPTYAARLESEGLLDAGDLDRFKREAEALVEAEARQVIEAPWPDASLAREEVFTGARALARSETLEPAARRSQRAPALPDVEPGPAFDAKGRTFLEAVMLGVGDALRADPRVFVYGEDVGGRYGNAFLLLKPLLSEFPDRIVNSP
ncbi:MAG TPA: thiamine pyrophosphate-dependent enzyme, partial [Thermoanaerobaculia bacterium]